MGHPAPIGLVEMAVGDTEAVMDAFKERINILASSLAQLEGGNQEDIYKELVTTFKSTMTDLTGSSIGRLPSAGTVSRLAVEASHLATIEVALAMNPQHRKRPLETASWRWDYKT